MKYVAVATAIVLLVVNTAFYELWTSTQDDDDDGWIDGGDGGDVVPIDAISVQVPTLRDGDILQYDYSFFAELFSLNKTSGNWSLIQLKANGQLLEQVHGQVSKKDGFNQPHDSWNMHTSISMSVRIHVEEHRTGEDNEPLIITGRIDADRDNWATLKGDVPIQNYAGGLLAIDEVKGLDLPVSNFEFSVDNWAYPDPHVEPERQLEERIYGDQATLSEGLNGTYWASGEEQWTGWGFESFPYNWSIDSSERVRDYDCVKLNISMSFYGVINLTKFLWLSSDVPRPVRVMYNSSLFWDEANESGRIVLETEQTLQRNGYTRGGSVVQVDRDAEESFVETHPLAEMRDWDIAPEDGSLSSSSFELGLEEALDHALANSDGLNDWMRTHPSPMVTGTRYWANKTDQRTMEYTWNISLEDEPGDWESWEDWYHTNGYSVNVTKRVTQRLVGGPDVEVFIASEYGPRRGAAATRKNDLSDQMVTLGSSERVWASVSHVADDAYTGLDRKVDFTDASYSLSMGGIDAGGFGIDFLDTLTGITVPTTRYTWSLQLGTVWAGAATNIATVDAETGRMVTVTEVTGPQSLQFILGNL